MKVLGSLTAADGGSIDGDDTVDLLAVYLAATGVSQIKGFVADGNSITEGPVYLGVAPSYPTQLSRFTGLPVVNLGVSSRTLATMDSTYASRGVGGYYNPANATDGLLLGGINDILNTSGITLAMMQASETSYAAKMKADYDRIHRVTLLPVNGLNVGQQTLLANFNAWLRSNYAALGWDTLTDAAAISELQSPPSGVSTYYVDGLHPNPWGLSYLAHEVAKATGAEQVEYVPNGIFDDASGWIFISYTSGFTQQLQPSVGSAVGGKLRITAAAEKIYPEGVMPIVGLEVGETYRLVGALSSSTEYGGRIFVNNALMVTPSVSPFVYDSGDLEAPASIDATFVATQTTHFLRLLAACESAGAYTEFDNWSISKVEA